MKIREQIGKELLFFDGAMGTVLQSRGLQTGEIPETWNILHPEAIRQIHKEYLLAGCNITKANTFGVNTYKCKGTEYTVDQLVSAGIRITREAISETQKELGANAQPMYSALDIGSLGKLLKPLGEIAFEDAYNAFKEIVIAGDKAGADLILIETVSDSYEIKAAVLAAKENSNLPVVVTMIFDENGKLLTGGDVASVTAMLEGLGVDAIGFNCGLGPEQMLKLLPELTSCCSIPIAINPNAGLPVVIDGVTQFNVGPEEFAAKAKLLVEEGASMIGGCCGTTPGHLAELVRTCKGMNIQPVTDKNLTVISSYNHAVYFGRKPLIIGERINPTGKSKFKQALRDHNMEYIYEPKLMEEAITGIQAIIDLPLQIDTSDGEAMERALRCYNGKPMLNSVNGKKESMEMVFPLAKKYGAVVVCLCLDEGGIPETVEGRIAVAKKIVETARSYGIPKKNLVMDALVLTISTGQDNAMITLETLRRLRYELGLHTVLGVSNISFGLPERVRINTAFFTMAMQNGLSAGIVNPSSEAMMAAYYSFNALIGEDDNCMEYIQKCTEMAQKDSPSVAPKSAGSMSLEDAIVKGLSESAYQATEKLLNEQQLAKCETVISNKHIIISLLL